MNSSFSPARLNGVAGQQPEENPIESFIRVRTAQTITITYCTNWYYHSYISSSYIYIYRAVRILIT